MPEIRLDRATLAKFLPDPRAIAAFEQILQSIGSYGTLATQQADNVDITGGTISLSFGSAAVPSLTFGDPETGMYRIGLDQIGLSVAAVQLLALAAGLVSVTGTIQASGQLKSTVATGTAPLSVASTTQVPNLYASRAALADEATHATNADHATTADSATTATSATSATTATTAAGLSSPTTFPADATDLATCITLANALKAAGVAKGL